ncbi:hypothetical protein [Paenibacillus sp. NPDC057967]|uniref:hypothetical protein n=1 Tax=Paenibacillus sp. NPDC057967 TaxID=3346293 RepID=UPI0036DA64EF
MNPIFYQLHQAQIAADGGMLGPIRLAVDSLAIPSFNGSHEINEEAGLHAGFLYYSGFSVVAW